MVLAGRVLFFLRSPPYCSNVRNPAASLFIFTNSPCAYCSPCRRFFFFLVWVAICTASPLSACEANSLPHWARCHFPFLRCIGALLWRFLLIHRVSLSALDMAVGVSLLPLFLRLLCRRSWDSLPRSSISGIFFASPFCFLLFALFLSCVGLGGLDFLKVGEYIYPL